jgi:geranylgeranyl reductase family protein
VVSKYYDVVIVGAGPAGATLAYYLAQQGIEVIVLEKDMFPRYKCCAGGITRRALNLLGMDISEVVEDTVDSIKFSYKCGKTISFNDNEPFIFTVSRSKLDELLVNHAQMNGAIFSFGKTVTGITRNNSEVVVKTKNAEFRSKVVVGADGVYSIVAKEMGIKRSLQYLLGIQYEIPVSDYQLRQLKNTIHIQFGSIKGGYAWLFPKGNYISVGAGCYLTEAGNIYSKLHEFIECLGIDSITPSKKCSALIPVIKNNITCCGERFLLLGDAAGMADPLTGEGIYSASLSAKMAAHVINNALINGLTEFSAYQHDIDSIILPELKIAHKAAKLLERYPGLAFSILASNKPVWKNIRELLCGYKDYSSLYKKNYVIMRNIAHRMFKN